LFKSILESKEDVNEEDNEIFLELFLEQHFKPRKRQPVRNEYSVPVPAASCRLSFSKSGLFRLCSALDSLSNVDIYYEKWVIECAESTKHSDV
jgi:hypothetical protein